MLDRNVDAISRMVAVKAVCACEGRSKRRARAQRDCAGGEDSIGGEPATKVNSIGAAPL